MNHFDQIYQIYTLVKYSKNPVSKQKIVETLEVSQKTVTNRIAEMRDRYQAPLDYIRQGNGYVFSDRKYELHGVWFSQNELYALLMIEQQMELLEPGLISNQLKTAKQKITQLIQNNTQQTENPSQRLRLLSIHNKQIQTELFNHVAKATLKRKQLKITYQAHTNQAISQRIISPQRMVYYKNNWYVDAWCHNKQDTRTFAIDAIQKTKQLEKTAKEIPPDDILKTTASTYGIFSGTATQTAIIIFTAPNAHWVSKENWHSQQQGQWLDDSHYQLTIPYQKDQELIMDILKHGEHAQVKSPTALKNKMKQKIEKMQKNY